MVVQVDADPMNVLGVLKQKPGTGEGLLTGSTDVAGWFIFFCGQRRGGENHISDDKRNKKNFFSFNK